MTSFDLKYFQKFKYNSNQTEKYLKSACRDLKIAQQSNISEVQFQFTYNALIKLGIALISHFGYKVKSRSGHHIKILEKTASIIGDKDIYSIGNRMRKKRNIDLYDGGILISQKEAEEYKKWLRTIFLKVEIYLHGENRLF